jgi:hypothetical protein
MAANALHVVARYLQAILAGDRQDAMVTPRFV